MTAKQALQFFGLRDSPSVVVPEGGLLLPLIDGALTTSERGHGAPSGGGFLFPAFIQENRPLIQRFLFRYKLSSFNAARSPPMCTIAHSYGTLGRSCTQVRSSFCRGSVFARDKTGGGDDAHYSVTQPSQSAACSLAWERVSPSICSNDDVKLQLVDRVRPGVDLGSPTNSCKTFGTCNLTDMREASQLRAWQPALG